MADEKKEKPEKIKTLVNQGPAKMSVFGVEVGPGKSFELPLSKALRVLAHYKHVVDADSIVAGTSDAAAKVAELQAENKALKEEIAALKQDNSELTALMSGEEKAPAAAPAPKAK
jgi:cell shape-determining protein MreC